jgi:hypothetical protein
LLRQDEDGVGMILCLDIFQPAGEEQEDAAQAAAAS